MVECRLSAKLLAKSLIQGDRWTSILKLKYVLYSVPHTGGQVTYILKLKYVLYSVPHAGGQVDSILNLKYVLYLVPHTVGQVDLHTQAQVCSLLCPSYRGTGGPPYSSSSKFLTQSLIQGDRWTSKLKLKYVLCSVPHTGGQVDLHTQAQVCSLLSPSYRGTGDLHTKAQVCSLLSPSYRGTGGPPNSSSSMFFAQSLIQGDR